MAEEPEMHIFLIILILLLILAAAALTVNAVENNKYKKTAYYLQTRHPYSSVIFDKGRLGEFYIYKYLLPLEGYQKYLFNVYFPKENGETTEADVILIHESGIYVFESKNYGGWIFGTENQQYWTQTFPSGKGRSSKSRFLNPIIQNKVHLKWLRHYLEDASLPIYSYIVFSDRCTLKDIHLTSDEHHVINRYNILEEVKHNAANAVTRLSNDEIDSIYEKLYPLTQADDELRAKHIEEVNRKQEKASHTANYDNSSADAAEMICPRCGGRLVMRVAERGENIGKRFLGCSNFPKCRYIRNLPDNQSTNGSPTA